MFRLTLLVLLAICCWSPSAWSKPGYRWNEGQISAGPRVTHLTLSEADSEGELEMGGLGGMFRFRLDPNLAIETTLDIIAANQQVGAVPDAVSRVTVPITISALYYVCPVDRLQPYLLVGAGIAAHSIQYEQLGETLHVATPLLQVGAGVEYRFDSIRFDVSARLMYMSQDAEDVERDPYTFGAIVDGPKAYAPADGDRDLLGGMLTVGMLWAL